MNAMSMATDSIQHDQSGLDCITYGSIAIGDRACGGTGSNINRLFGTGAAWVPSISVWTNCSSKRR